MIRHAVSNLRFCGSCSLLFLLGSPIGAYRFGTNRETLHPD